MFSLLSASNQRLVSSVSQYKMETNEPQRSKGRRHSSDTRHIKTHHVLNKSGVTLVVRTCIMKIQVVGF